MKYADWKTPISHYDTDYVICQNCHGEGWVNDPAHIEADDARAPCHECATSGVCDLRG